MTYALARGRDKNSSSPAYCHSHWTVKSWPTFFPTFKKLSQLQYSSQQKKKHLQYVFDAYYSKFLLVDTVTTALCERAYFSIKGLSKWGKITLNPVLDFWSFVKSNFVKQEKQEFSNRVRIMNLFSLWIMFIFLTPLENSYFLFPSQINIHCSYIQIFTKQNCYFLNSTKRYVNDCTQR